MKKAMKKAKRPTKPRRAAGSPGEALGRIRRRAEEAANALGELAVDVCDMRYACPTHPASAEMRWWWAFATSAMDVIGDVAVRAGELSGTGMNGREGADA